MLHLAFSVDQPVAKIAVRLNDVAPDGASTRITYTLFGLNHAWDQAKPIALEPGKIYRADIPLNTIAYAGRRGPSAAGRDLDRLLAAAVAGADARPR